MLNQHCVTDLLSVEYPWKVCNPCPLGSVPLLGWIWNGLVVSSQWAGELQRVYRVSRVWDIVYLILIDTVHSECSTISIWVSSGNKILCSRLHRSRSGLLLAFTGGGCTNIRSEVWDFLEYAGFSCARQKNGAIWSVIPLNSSLSASGMVARVKRH